MLPPVPPALALANDVMRHIPMPVHLFCNETSVLQLSSSADKQSSDGFSEVIDNISTCFEALFHHQPAIRLLVILNLAIFVAWHTLPNKFMEQHFISSTKNDRAHRWWSGFLSTFSHISLSHLGGNLGCLSLFGPPSYTYLGPARFCVLVIFSAYASKIIPDLWNKSGLVSKTTQELGSLGFSGVNCALFVVYATARPNEQISMNGQGFVLATSALKTAVLADFCGLVSTTKFFNFNSPIGHAAHLGGYISGYLAIIIFKALIRCQRIMTSRFHECLRCVRHFIVMTNPMNARSRAQQRRRILVSINPSHAIIFCFVGVILATYTPLVWKSRQFRKLKRHIKGIANGLVSKF